MNNFPPVSFQYSNPVWMKYAKCHASISSKLQRELYEACATHLFGDIGDFGCGTAKIAPYLVHQSHWRNYLGVDACSELLETARNSLNALSDKRLSLIHSKIESLSNYQFDSILSINSYYAWQAPEATLANIFNLLKKGGRFILVTPNKELDIKALLDDARQELIAHPDFDTFVEQNLQLAANENNHFADMDELVRNTQAAGFSLISCHQQFYLGGLNFLLLEKG